MSDTRSHAKGLLITAVGVLVLTPDSLIVRLIGGDPWGLIFWRGILLAAGLAVGLLLVHRGETLARCRAVGRDGLWIALLMCFSTIGFLHALAWTTVANTLIIISASPLFAALFSRVFLAETIPPRTWAAMLAAVVGIGVLVADSLISAGRAGALAGDFAALCAAVTLAGSFTVMRRAKAVSMVPASALGSLLSAVVALAVGAPLAVAPGAWPLLLLLGLVILPVATALITLGPRYLPAPEVSLLMLLETVLGPFWVWLVLREVPTPWALAGGAIVIAALCLHSLAGLRAARAVQAA